MGQIIYILTSLQMSSYECNVFDVIFIIFQDGIYMYFSLIIIVLLFTSLKLQEIVNKLWDKHEVKR
jgi:hypothetical protein